MYDALYARQSIEKVDSISIESQLEYCRYETHGNLYTEYIDKGYSGKNTNRPAFEEMIKDIKQHKISRVIVYKLDRISRSILDFSNMMDILQKYNVEFISSTERFDTSSPIGRAMLSICMVFAQLERETIQKRVSDTYYARSKRGLYMGGRIPYGFKKNSTILDGIKTSMYIPIKEEVEQICLMYSLYSNPQNSLNDIISYFNKHDIKHLRNSTWNTARISELLHNPIYVKADINIYDFLKSHGANIINPISDFTGHNGCYLYKGTKSTTNKKYDLTDKEIVLAPHEGIISSKDWIKCRIRCLNNRQSTRTHKPKNSWLIGKVKCGKCGHSLTISKSNTKWHRYFLCSNMLATKKSKCQGTGGTIYADVLEEYILNQVYKRLLDFKTLSNFKECYSNPKINQNKILLAEIDNKIETLISKSLNANTTVMEYINKSVESLDAKRKQIQQQILYLTHQINNDPTSTISTHIEKWKEASFEDKQAITDIFIKVIKISDTNIEIIWNI